MRKLAIHINSQMTADVKTHRTCIRFTVNKKTLTDKKETKKEKNDVPYNGYKLKVI